MKHDLFDVAQAECIQTLLPDLASILLNYVVIFGFVYILYNSVCFTFLVNWPTIQFLKIYFSKNSILLGVWPHLRNSKTCVPQLVAGWLLTVWVVSFSKNIDYRLRSDNFRWYCPFYLSRIINRRSLVF